MKGGAIYGIEGLKFLLIVGALICTVFLLGWKQPPFLTEILPSQSRIWGFSPDILLGAPVIPLHEGIPPSLRNKTLNKDGGVGESPNNPAVSTTNDIITSNKACNYAQGKWVADERRPFYSGAGCKQWLSAMWACRMTERTDFEYEKFRWQPFFCETKEFNGAKFLKRMQDKTLAFIGDSLGRQQFQSLMCMITSGQERNDVMDVGWEYGLVKAPGAKRPDGWAYRFPYNNTTILFYWSSCLCDLVPLNHSDPETETAMHLDRPPSFLARYIQKFHILVLNTGHHWNPGKIDGNRWVMYVKGKPNTDNEFQKIRKAKNFTLHNIVHWVDSQIQNQPELKAFLRSMSPRHFFNGDWNTGGTCDNRIPLSRGNKVLKEESSDLVSARAVVGTKVKLLDITALSGLRDEGHISKYNIRGNTETHDCLHWCLPGIPDTWNEILFAQL